MSGYKIQSILHPIITKLNVLQRLASSYVGISKISFLIVFVYKINKKMVKRKCYVFYRYGVF